MILRRVKNGSDVACLYQQMKNTHQKRIFKHSNKSLALAAAFVGFLTRTFAIGVVSFYTWSIYDFCNLLFHAIYYKTWKSNWCSYWIMIDLAFAFLIEIQFKRTKRAYLPSADKEAIQSLLMELNNKSMALIEEFIEGWFDCSSKHIGRADFYQWAACMCFNITPDELNESQSADINMLIDAVEEKLDHKFMNGFGKPKIKILLTLDPLQIFHRPLLFYALIMGVDCFTRVSLWNQDFKRIAEHGIITYIRRGSSSELPIVFFHGIGIGLAPYLRLLFSIATRFPNRTIIAFEKKAISMQLTTKIMLPDEYAEKVFKQLKNEKIEKIVTIGHSLGTIVMCWLDKYYPGLVHSRIFIDPVCFTLWTHDIARNFVYRNPTHLKHYLLKYFAAMEPGISLYLRRYFV